MRNYLLSSAAAVAIGLSSGLAGATTLTIVTPGATPTDTHHEVSGDPGGTVFPFANGGGINGPGVPSALAGWPGGPGFAPDPSFGNNPGTSGFHGSYVKIDDTGAAITFQYMGKGDSGLANSFQVFHNGAWATLFTAGASACGASGPAPVVPVCTPGANQFTLTFQGSDYFQVGGDSYVPFRYVTGAGVDVTNNGVDGNPDTTGSNGPGYFLGVDPYLASGPFALQGDAVYAGLTDLPGTGDHDFQDFGVRMSVPEPVSLSILGVGLAGLAVSRRRVRTLRHR